MQATKKTRNPFYGTSGPRDADIVIVGEAWGQQEAAAQAPFVGYSGQELDRILMEAGIIPSACFKTNLVAARPPDNDITNFFYKTLEKKNAEVQLYRGLYPRPNILAGIENLKQQIEKIRPRLVLAVGNYALWALTDNYSVGNTRGYKVPTGIVNWRGSQLNARPTFGLRSAPVLPIIHPAAILREWGYRQLTVHDLKTRAPLAGTSEWEEPVEYVNALWKPSWVDATTQLHRWEIMASEAEKNDTFIEISTDIETWQKQWIACIGLAVNREAICIPLFYFEKGKVVNYWPHQQELMLITRIRRLLSRSGVKVIGQNFLYDLQYLSAHWFLEPTVSFDTMLAHHVLWPGTPKGLHNLSSLYCRHHVYWKDESEEWDVKAYGHEDLWKYNCKDVLKPIEIAETLKRLLTWSDMWPQYNDAQEQMELAFSMMKRGVRINKEVRNEVRLELLQEVGRVSDYLLQCVPKCERWSGVKDQTPWFRSNTQLQRIFYDLYKVKPVLHKKTRRPTTDKNALPILAKRLPLFAPIMKMIEDLRSKSVYINNFLNAKLDPDGRMRCSFNPAGTDTFRWSSSENAFGRGGNLQNIPEGDEDV